MVIKWTIFLYLPLAGKRRSLPEEYIIYCYYKLVEYKLNMQSYVCKMTLVDLSILIILKNRQEHLNILVLHFEKKGSIQMYACGISVMIVKD